MQAGDDLKLSVAEWCYFKDQYEPEEYYRRLRAMGYRGVEMVDPSRYAAAKAAGLQLINTMGPTGLNRIENHPVAVDRTRQVIASAAQHGMAQVIVFSGNREGQPDVTGMVNCVAALKAVAADAERAGVILTFEVFNKYDHPDYQADYSDYAFEVVRQVSSPAVKVLYDLYHMHRMGEDVADVVTRHLPYIAHLHVAGSPRRDFPGTEQELDYTDVVQRITAAGYRGYWGMEFRPQGDSLNELDAAATLFRRYAVDAASA